MRTHVVSSGRFRGWTGTHVELCTAFAVAALGLGACSGQVLSPGASGASPTVVRDTSHPDPRDVVGSCAGVRKRVAPL